MVTRTSKQIAVLSSTSIAALAALTSGSAAASQIGATVNQLVEPNTSFNLGLGDNASLTFTNTWTLSTAFAGMDYYNQNISVSGVNASIDSFAKTPGSVITPGSATSSNVKIAGVEYLPWVNANGTERQPTLGEGGSASAVAEEITYIPIAISGAQPENGWLAVQVRDTSPTLDPGAPYDPLMVPKGASNVFSDESTLLVAGYGLDTNNQNIAAGEINGAFLPVPEPDSLALLAAGFAGMVAYRRNQLRRIS